MPYFFVDDGFSDSKEVLSIPARHRLAAIGLWTLCGAWCMAKLTDGFIPDEALKRIGGRPALVEALIESTLWERVPCGIRFTNWSKWQRTREQVASYRAWDAERKRERRRRSKDVPTSDDDRMSPRDFDGDADERPQGTPTTPVPVPVPVPKTDTYVGNESSLNVGDCERGLSGPVTPSATRLVAALIPDKFPSAVRTALRLQASALMNGDGVSAAEMSDALRKWLAKPDAGPGLLPHLVADVQRAKAAPAERSTVDRKVDGWLNMPISNPPTREAIE